MINKVWRRLQDEQNPSRFIISRALWHTGLCNLFKIKQDNYQIHFFPTAVSATIFTYPRFNYEDQSLLKTILRPGDTFVDIGANIGNLSLYASTLVGDTGNVFAFEPHPKIFNFLKKNIELNKFSNITAKNCGMGNESTTLTFTDSKSDDQNRIESNEQSPGIKVKVHKLDDFNSIGPVRLLKVDTEGYEKFVFEGAASFLNQVEYIYFETNEDNCRRFNYKTSDLLEILSSQHDFNFFEFKNNRLVPYSIGQEELPDNLLASRLQTTNFHY